MSPRNAPSEERLLAYAAGSLSPPEAVVVAAYLDMHPDEERWVRRLQAVGGKVLSDETPAELSLGALDRALARIETDAGAPPESDKLLNDMAELPRALRRYRLGKWRTVGPKIRVRDVHAPRDGRCRVVLLEIGPGQSSPVHSHDGVELTLVLTGAYTAGGQRFEAGDFEEADEDTVHQPRVDGDAPCLCVAALDGQIRLQGLLGRIIQPFARL